MNILLVVTKGDLGGAQQVVLDLAQELDVRGHDVTVAYGEQGTYLPDQLKKENIPVHTFSHLSRSKNPITGFRFSFELKQFVQKEGFDIVHLHSSNTLFGALGLQFTSARSVFTFHGMSVLSGGYQKAKVLKLIYGAYFALLARFLDAAIYLTDADQNVGHKWLMRPGRKEVIPNGIKPEEIGYFSSQEARRQLSKTIDQDLERATLVGSIGRLHYQKNYEFLIQAAEKLKDTERNLTWVVIGDGPKRSELHQLIKKKGLQDTVFFAGAIPQAAQLIPAFDIFTLTSRYEGLPITLIEALFADVPILASDVGGNAEVVADTEHSLYQPGDTEAFKGQLVNLVNDSELRDDIVHKQNEHRTQFTFASVLDQHIHLYHQLMSR